MRYSTKVKLQGYATLAFLILLAAGVCGWVMNIIELFNTNFSVITGELVVRVIGVFLPPIGAIVGWF